jgi:hypothetical protein
MKKTLLAVAAALAASVISSQAQVYSQNVVGYYNVTAQPNKFTLIANQLDTGSNTVNNVFQNGLISNGGSGGTTISFWNGAGFATWYYYSAADAAPSPGGWYNSDGSIYCGTNAALSTAYFLFNGATTNITVTVVGTVTQGTNIYSVPSGLSFLASPIPLGGTSPDNSSVGMPAASTADTVQIWTGTGYGPQYTYYSAADAAPSPAGWYNSDGSVDESTNAAAWPNVGNGFLINHTGAALIWTNVFSVQ